MVVGEPTLMGGEFGDEDERLITRLENQQFEPNSGDPETLVVTLPVHARVTETPTHSHPLISLQTHQDSGRWIRNHLGLLMSPKPNNPEVICYEQLPHCQRFLLTIV